MSGALPKGFPAGCPFATSNVQMYSAPPLDLRVSEHPKVTPSNFIDDFMPTSSNGNIHRFIADLAEGAHSMLDMIAQDLNCRIALHKASALGSSAKVRQKLTKAQSNLAGPHGEHQDAAPSLESTSPRGPPEEESSEGPEEQNRQDEETTPAFGFPKTRRSQHV